MKYITITTEIDTNTSTKDIVATISNGIYKEISADGVAPPEKIKVSAWINVKDELPIDHWNKQFPNSNNSNTLDDCLVVFEDRDENGRWLDSDVVAVTYDGTLGWIYYSDHDKKYDKESVQKITKWMPFPSYNY